MIFLIPLVFGAIGVAVGAVAGAFTTHAAGEKDRQAAKHHRKVANELTEKYSALEKRYYEFAEESKKQISDLTRQHALDEVEKDCLRLALRLQQHLLSLMQDIDGRPSKAALKSFRDAVDVTNKVLGELNEELIFIPSDYFIRNMVRARRLEQLTVSKENETSKTYVNEQYWCKKEQIIDIAHWQQSEGQADAYFNQGIDCIRQGDYQGALGDFNKVLRFNPDYYEA
jgi:tetratricopeptide (TPR) repeat protein